MDKDEEFEARRSAVTEVTDRLRSRGVAVTGAENPEDLVNLLSAVERFESAVEAHGGDLMVDDLKSSRPDDQHFVVPRRAHGEVMRVYIGRIDEATMQLRRHPRQPKRPTSKQFGVVPPYARARGQLRRTRTR